MSQTCLDIVAALSASCGDKAKDKTMAEAIVFYFYKHLGLWVEYRNLDRGVMIAPDVHAAIFAAGRRQALQDLQARRDPQLNQHTGDASNTNKSTDCSNLEPEARDNTQTDTDVTSEDAAVVVKVDVQIVDNAGNLIHGKKTQTKFPPQE